MATALGRRVARLVAVALTALLGLGLTPGLGGTPAAQAAVPKTRLVLKIAGCDRCRVDLVQAIQGTSIYWHSRKQRVGGDGRVVFTVPTRRTHGMSFELRVPWESARTESILNVATRYRGQEVDETWTAHQAKHARRAFGCWAGTEGRRATLRFHVAGFRFDAGDSGRARAAVAWASPGLESWRPAMRTWHGRIANQDAFYCERP